MEDLVKSINTYFSPVHRRYLIAMFDVFIIWLNIWHESYLIWFIIAVLNIPLLTVLYFDLEKAKVPKKKDINNMTIIKE